MEAARLKSAGLRKGFDVASGAIDTGLGQARTDYGAARDYFTPLAGTANAGYGAYGDATGAAGVEGLDRARGLFTQTPGYKEGLDSSLDQLDRRNASRGLLGSGNTIDATAKIATDYSNQKYGDYVSHLSPYLSGATGIASAQAGLTAGMGDKAFTAGATRGNLGFQTEAGIGEAQGAAELSKDQSGLNLINSLMGGLNMAGKFAGVGGFAPSFGGGGVSLAPSPNGPGTYYPMYR